LACCGGKRDEAVELDKWENRGLAQRGSAKKANARGSREEKMSETSPSIILSLSSNAKEIWKKRERESRKQCREVRKAKEGFCLHRVERKKKKIILLLVESIDGWRAARFGEMLGTRYARVSVAALHA
jgi:hypothetical protein